VKRAAPLRATLAAALSATTALAPAAATAQDPGAVVRVSQGGQGATATSLVLPFGKSAIVDLPEDAADILLSNPQIADAVIRTPRRVYIVGRAMGQTNAFFFNSRGGQIANIEIRIEPDVGPLNELFARYSPQSQIRAEALNGSLVLTGFAKSAAEADRALQMAQSFLGTAGGTGAGAGSTPGGANTAGVSTSGGVAPRIVNLIQVEGSEQVLVRVRVVEMSRTLVRQLGVNLNYDELVNRLLPEDAFVDIATRNGYSIAGRLLGGFSGSGGVAETILSPSSLTYPYGRGYTGESPSNAGVGGYSQKLLLDASGNPVLSPSGQPLYEITYGPAEAQTSRQTDASIEAFERAGLLRVLA